MKWNSRCDSVGDEALSWEELESRTFVHWQHPYKGVGESCSPLFGHIKIQHDNTDHLCNTESQIRKWICQNLDGGECRGTDGQHSGYDSSMVAMNENRFPTSPNVLIGDLSLFLFLCPWSVCEDHSRGYLKWRLSFKLEVIVVFYVQKKTRDLWGETNRKPVLTFL